MASPITLRSSGNGQHSTLWENVLRHLHDAVIVLSREATIVFINQAAEELTRMPRTKVLGHPCAEVLPESSVLLEMFERTQTSRQSETRSEENLSINQLRVPLRITCVPIWDDLGEVDGATLVLQDISQQKALEESARRNESLARLGTLVAGLAHEVRNPLAGIKGAAQLLQQRLAGDNDLTEYTRVISRETDRLSDLVEDLLRLGAPPKPTLASVNIHEILQRVFQVVAAELRQHGLTLNCKFDPSLPNIMADSAQLQQVFLNLMKNAIDATTSAEDLASELSVSTKIESDYYVLRGKGSAQSYLRVEINDGGPGIDPEILSQIFEPFYTTKPRGTGLGLAIAQRIVSDHDGTMRAIPLEPTGTSIRVSLPIHRQ